MARFLFFVLAIYCADGIRLRRKAGKKVTDQTRARGVATQQQNKGVVTQQQNTVQQARSGDWDWEQMANADTKAWRQRLFDAGAPFLVYAPINDAVSEILRDIATKLAAIPEEDGEDQDELVNEMEEQFKAIEEAFPRRSQYGWLYGDAQPAATVRLLRMYLLQDENDDYFASVWNHSTAGRSTFMNLVGAGTWYNLTANQKDYQLQQSRALADVFFKQVPDSTAWKELYKRLPTAGDHKAAITSYTSPWLEVFSVGYKTINKRLRDWSLSDQVVVESYKIFMGLQDCSSRYGEVFRRLSRSGERLRQGQFISDLGFMSTTYQDITRMKKDDAQALAHGNIVFKILLPEGKARSRGKSISSLSAITAEREVLFPPGVVFRVDRVDKDYEAVNGLPFTFYTLTEMPNM